jgi:hypothetical protein
MLICNSSEFSFSQVTLTAAGGDDGEKVRRGYQFPPRQHYLNMHHGVPINEQKKEGNLDFDLGRAQIVVLAVRVINLNIQ